MSFCPNCGHPQDGSLAGPAPEPMEVTLARIAKEQAVEVARIEASAARAELRTAETIAETEADAQVETAEAVATIIAAEPEPEPAPEPEPLPEPVVVEPAAPEPSDAPPIVEHHEPRARQSAGWWDGYR